MAFGLAAGFALIATTIVWFLPNAVPRSLKTPPTSHSIGQIVRSWLLWPALALGAMFTIPQLFLAPFAAGRGVEGSHLLLPCLCRFGLYLSPLAYDAWTAS